MATTIDTKTTVLGDVLHKAAHDIFPTFEIGDDEFAATDVPLVSVFRLMERGVRVVRSNETDSRVLSLLRKAHGKDAAISTADDAEVAELRAKVHGEYLAAIMSGSLGAGRTGDGGASVRQRAAFAVLDSMKIAWPTMDNPEYDAAKKGSRKTVINEDARDAMLAEFVAGAEGKEWTGEGQPSVPYRVGVKLRDDYNEKLAALRAKKPSARNNVSLDSLLAAE